MASSLDSALGVLNGLIGDHLARTANGLEIPMGLVHDGHPVAVERSALARALPTATSRAVLLVHGALGTARVWQPRRGGDTGAPGRDYGALLARDLGFTPLFLRYNSGRAIADNGAALAELLEGLVAAYPAPLDEILLVAHSMGGLVVRSACQVARSSGQRWLGLVRRAVYLGTPHRGAPLERWGRTLAAVLRAVNDPYTRLVADLGDLRSDGIKDLGDGDLRQQDRARRRPLPRRRERCHPVPLLPEIEHYLIAASLARGGRVGDRVGDLLVPVASATDGCESTSSAALPAAHVRVFSGVGHLDLARHPAVYEQLRAWLEGGR